MTMDFQSAMETFAEAWVAASIKGAPISDVSSTQSQALALTRNNNNSNNSNNNNNNNNNNHSKGSPLSSSSRRGTSRESAERTLSETVQSTASAITATSTAHPSATSSTIPLENGTIIIPPPPTLTAPSTSSSPSPQQQQSSLSIINVKQESSLGKSLPVHCIVESISALTDSDASALPSAHHGTSSIWHENDQKSQKRRIVLETDTYVIIPVGTPFQDLVQVALFRLGYSADSAAAAKGSVLIKNWKALNFDQIADDPLLTVGDILGELSTMATLRIQVFRSRPGSFTDIKDKLLKYLLLQSHTILLSSGCPLDEIILSQICRNISDTSYPEISDETKRKFDIWWSSQFNSHLPQNRADSFLPTYANHQSYSSSVSAAAAAAAAAAATVHHRSVPSQSLNQTAVEHSLSESSISTSHQHHHHHQHQSIQPSMHSSNHHQFPTQQKTRMRTSFDPELELPKLQRWFAENQHPSRQQIQQYVKELNGLESRRGRKPLDINNVVYWFKNARAAQKRAEIRSVHLPVVVNGFNTNKSLNSSHTISPTDGAFLLSDNNFLNSDINRLKHGQGISRINIPGNAPQQNSNASDELSNVGSSDIEEDEELIEVPQSSPSGPLSLTTTNRKSPSRDGSSKISPSPSPSLSPIPDIQSEQCEEKNNEDEPVNYSSSSLTTDNNNSNNNKHINENSKDMFTRQIKRTHSMTEKGSKEDNDDVDDDQDHDDIMDDDTDKNLYDDNNTQLIRHHHRRLSSSPDLIRQQHESFLGTPSAFPLVPNTMFTHNIMYMSQYIPGLTTHASSLTHVPSNCSNSALNHIMSNAVDERRKRNRTFIDPVTEVPRLEQWFSHNTHPSHNLIIKYTEELNCMAYRQKFPRLEPKNVQFWFKNRRAKCKRLKMSLYDDTHPTQHNNSPYHHHHHYGERD